MNIFQNPTKSVPKKDDQIVRVGMEQDEIVGRKDHLPNASKDNRMTIKHVGNEG